jgi:hypothetical protein
MVCRLQKEKEDALADIDCKREQYDKLQVGTVHHSPQSTCPTFAASSTGIPPVDGGTDGRLLTRTLLV